MNDANRIAELEAELTRVKAERDLYKSGAYLLLRKNDPYQRMSEADVDELLASEHSVSISEVLAEFAPTGASK